MIQEKEIRKITEEFLQGSDLFIVEVIIRPTNKITVYIDGESRVAIDACRNVSHFIEGNLDREKEDFELTVSSSGADRPLKIPRQYKKVVGNSLDLVTTDGKKITGDLISAGDEGIEMTIGKVKRFFSFDEIKTAKEVITFKK